MTGHCTENSRYGCSACGGRQSWSNPWWESVVVEGKQWWLCGGCVRSAKRDANKETKASRGTWVPPNEYRHLNDDWHTEFKEALEGICRCPRQLRLTGTKRPLSAVPDSDWLADPSSILPAVPDSDDEEMRDTSGNTYDTSSSEYSSDSSTDTAYTFGDPDPPQMAGLRMR